MRTEDAGTLMTICPLLEDGLTLTDFDEMEAWIDMRMPALTRRARCERRGHQWWPESQAREFFPVHAACLRCRTDTVFLPYGECIRQHPLVDHYDPNGDPRRVSDGHLPE